MRRISQKIFGMMRRINQKIFGMMRRISQKIFGVMRRISQKIFRMMRRIGRKMIRIIKKLLRGVIRIARRIYRKIYRTVRKGRQKIRKFLRYKKKFTLILQKSKEGREIKKRDRVSRKDFLKNLLPVLDKMPSSNGSKYYEKQKIKIAIVADEFLYDSFKDISEFIYVKPDTYQDYIDQVEFLLVVSAWRGLNGEWMLMTKEGSENNRIVFEMIDAYKKKGKPVVFYSKEDPPNYEFFLPIAKKCDVIFTSCLEKIDDYKRDCKTENVYVMEFCINPVFHNPIGMKNANRSNGVFFAGSWMQKYPERVKALEIMLDGVLAAGRELVIADRNYYRNNIFYFFPSKYYPYITREIPHDYLQKVHKLYDWAININSVTESRTMFANRVYELQANGCLMISNRSVGVQEKFPEIIIVNTVDDVANALERYNEEEIYEHQIAGVRRVMTGETNYDRIVKMFDILGIDIVKIERSILVVAEKITHQIMDEFNSQTYPNRRLIAMDDLTADIYNQYDAVTKWDEQSIYEKYYLEDMMNGFKYTDCDYIVKASYRENGRLINTIEHDFVDLIPNVYAAMFWRESIEFEKFLNMRDGISMPNGYSIDHFNYERFNS